MSHSYAFPFPSNEKPVANTNFFSSEMLSACFSFAIYIHLFNPSFLNQNRGQVAPLQAQAPPPPPPPLPPPPPPSQAPRKNLSTSADVRSG
ncbi:hypothetical protein EV421DRAFT_2034366 [Armillaria borealis]|uniref:Uncharacterized protein n=1 Tax=Armillaria borealis TaxID=47425 RepID=A0AA39MTR7_9AGAR|nr:hypothetical protein EV421DRAFT_2034366 [Armillaria borealis]